MTIYIGQSYKVLADFRDINQAPADPTTVTFTKQGPDNTLTTVLQASLTHEDTGLWSYTTSESAKGKYLWEVKGTGAVTARDITEVVITAGIS